MIQYSFISSFERRNPQIFAVFLLKVIRKESQRLHLFDEYISVQTNMTTNNGLSVLDLNRQIEAFMILFSPNEKAFVAIEANHDQSYIIMIDVSRKAY